MKNLLLAAAFLLCRDNAGAQSGVHGVVTYYFNDNYGYKPDVGSDVWLVDTLQAHGFDKWAIERYMQASPSDKGFNQIDKMHSLS